MLEQADSFRTQHRVYAREGTRYSQEDVSEQPEHKGGGVRAGLVEGNDQVQVSKELDEDGET